MSDDPRSLRDLISSLPIGEQVTDERAGRLIVEIETEVRVEQLVDLPAYFNGFPEGERASYRHYAEANEGGYADWELPVAYLSQGVYETLEVNLPFLSFDCSDFERSDIDEVRTETRAYKGQFVSRHFSIDDYDFLRSKVAWLNAVHALLNGEEGASEEDIARIPGPHDIPLI